MIDTKFRVWDKIEKSFWGEGRNLSLVSLVSDSLVNDDTTVLEQSTNLKDVNGDEIFVGDILQYQNNKKDINIIEFGEFGIPDVESEEYMEKAVGFYLSAAGNLKNVYPFCLTIPLNARYSKDYIIVGNIHENADLLVKK